MPSFMLLSKNEQFCPLSAELILMVIIINTLVKTTLNNSQLLFIYLLTDLFIFHV